MHRSSEFKVRKHRVFRVQNDIYIYIYIYIYISGIETMVLSSRYNFYLGTSTLFERLSFWASLLKEHLGEGVFRLVQSCD